MYRRRTVEALLRQQMREKEQLLTIIRDQNDRIMTLAGVRYAPTPAELHDDAFTPVEPDVDELIDLGQAEYDLGHDPY